MRARRIGWGAAALALLAACSSGPSAAVTPPANPVDGLISKISGTTITLRTGDGDLFDFEVVDENVPIDHLDVHRRDRLPVRVYWTSRDGVLDAEQVDDAPAT